MRFIEAIKNRALDSVRAAIYRVVPHMTVLTPSGDLGDVLRTNIPEGTVTVETMREEEEVFPGHDVTGIVLPRSDDITRGVNNENIFKETFRK